MASEQTAVTQTHFARKATGFVRDVKVRLRDRRLLTRHTPSPSLPVLIVQAGASLARPDGRVKRPDRWLTAPGMVVRLATP